jgi:hypothetical protein
MDIHKPKPWHNVREFLKEYVIIVVGVLTALGAEQGVDWLHRGAELREAREALHAEITTDAHIALFSIAEDDCLGAVLDRYAAWSRGGPKPPALRSNFPPLFTSSWETVKAGAAARMPLTERLAYAKFYDVVANAHWSNETQRNTYLQLVATNSKAVLDADEARRLLEAVDQARLLGLVRSANARGLLDRAKEVGVDVKGYTISPPIACQTAVAPAPRG